MILQSTIPCSIDIVNSNYFKSEVYGTKNYRGIIAPALHTYRIIYIVQYRTVRVLSYQTGQSGTLCGLDWRSLELQTRGLHVGYTCITQASPTMASQEDLRDLLRLMTTGRNKLAMMAAMGRVKSLQAANIRRWAM